MKKIFKPENLTVNSEHFFSGFFLINEHVKIEEKCTDTGIV
jgi:hypothetical protein